MALEKWSRTVRAMLGRCLGRRVTSEDCIIDMDVQLSEREAAIRKREKELGEFSQCTSVVMKCVPPLRLTPSRPCPLPWCCHCRFAFAR